MNNRERFLRVMDYQPVDRVPDFEFGYWDECYEAWRPEGFPVDINNIWDAERYFGFEYYCSVPANNCILPGFDQEVLETRGDHRIVRGVDGVIYEESISGVSIPKYVKFPIETRSDWAKFRDERLNPDNPERIPGEEFFAQQKDRDYPLCVGGGSIYGWLRNWMGVENLSIATMEDPEWVDEMMEHLVELTISVLSRVMGKVDADFGMWWEDMCYNHGPLVSPRFFNQVMVPKYKKITSFMADYGISHHVLDCDGKIDELVPGWLDAGIDVMFPLEAAHTDQAKLRHQYGKQIRFMGGVNKMTLIKGKEAIDAELGRIAVLLEEGGFIPHVDHRCPPDVTLENYRYYIERKREIIGRSSV